MIVRLLILLCLLPAISNGQALNGKITNDQNQPLAGATVSWTDAAITSVSTDDGSFSIPLPDRLPQTLTVSFAGYSTHSSIINDTSFLNIQLMPGKTLGEVRVRSKRNAIYISDNAAKTEVITSGELKKSACCDLAGCFETQGTVQPQTTNIVTNSKELRILGLSGVYNQILIDGFPMIQGLTYTYGISSLPGPLVSEIFVAKGATSVLQGFESISGQINVITKAPDRADKLLLNAYINSFSEKQFNALYAVKKEKWSNLTAFHTTQPATRIDKDDDRFMDVPLITRYMITNHWMKNGNKDSGWSTQFSLRYLYENRIGGQMQFDYEEDKGGDLVYGQAVRFSQPEGWLRSAYSFNEKNRIELFASSFRQDQQSYFGVTSYKAGQTNLYLNLQHELSYGGGHTLKSGLSYRYSDLKETISFSSNALGRTYAGDYLTRQINPGIFAENTFYSNDGRLTWIAGVRADKQNGYGWRLTPRTMLKFEAEDKLILRASAGTGWRIARIFSENVGLLASSRDIIFAEKLNPEAALNMGCNALFKFSGENTEGFITVDAYHTVFRNQIFPDYDADPTLAIISNFTGRSVSNGLQLEGQLALFEKISLKAGYIYLDVYQEINGVKEQLPFNPQNRVFATASFAPLNKKWHWDANFHWYGKQRLPDTESNPVQYRRPGYSDPYSIVSTQFTFRAGEIELYGGVENIFNFRQYQPIISWQDPFGQYFDTQFAWGPTRGIEFYAGVRFVIE